MLQLIWDHQIEYLRETVYLRIFKSLTETASTFLLQVGLILAWVYWFQRNWTVLFWFPELDQRWPELDDGFKAKQLGDSSTDRGLTGSPCETKQSTSCSVKPGRSFWLQFCLGTPQQSWDTERASRGNRCNSTQTYMHMCTVALSGKWLLVLGGSDIGSRWRNILMCWEKEIMHENALCSHKLCWILRLLMTDTNDSKRKFASGNNKFHYCHPH